MTLKAAPGEGWKKTEGGVLVPPGTELGPVKAVGEKPTYYESVQDRCREAIALLEQKGFSDGSSAMDIGLIRDLIMASDTQVEKNFGVTLGDKRHHVFTSFLVVDDEIIKPVKGGCRASDHLDLETDKALARGMTLKCFLNGVPYGGAKSGIVVNLDEYDNADQEVIVKGWARAFKDFLGPSYYISAPDVGTGPQFADWVHDALTYGRPAGRSLAGSIITGKSVEVGGIVGRAGATGKGLVIIAGMAVDEFEGGTLDGKTVVVEGLGKVGSAAVEGFHKEKSTIIAIKEKDEGIVNPNGLDVPALLKHWKENDTFEGFPGGRIVKGEENQRLLETECDILALCALENTVTEENAGNIRAKYVIEGANGPVTIHANRILAEKDIKVLADILSNSGGVRVSWLEDQQERIGGKFGLDEVNEKLRNGLVETFNEVMEAAKHWEVDPSTAAYMLAVERQAKHHLKKGLRP
jgi:glutamate dehydrogenase/leucine dehydrogenase